MKKQRSALTQPPAADRARKPKAAEQHVRSGEPGSGDAASSDIETRRDEDRDRMTSGATGGSPPGAGIDRPDPDVESPGEVAPDEKPGLRQPDADAPPPADISPEPVKPVGGMAADADTAADEIGAGDAPRPEGADLGGLAEQGAAPRAEVTDAEGEAAGEMPRAGAAADETISPDSAAAPFEAETAEPHATPSEEPALLKPPAAAPGQAATGDDGRVAPPSGSNRRGSVLPLIISLIALLAVGLIGWQVYELRLASKETRQEVAQRLTAGDAGVAELRGLARQQSESIAALQSRFGALESQVAAFEGQAAALESIYLEQSRSRAEQVLAEVEQAINIAAQQLQLAGNFEAALIALQGAEARLALPELGHLQALRRALIADIEQLKAHPQVDVSGLALRLEILLDRVDGLPLAFEAMLDRAAAEREQLRAERERGEAGPFSLSLEYARALASDVWNEIKGMVRLERLDQADPVLLSPEQSTYLRENVKIRLLTARLALLARDGRTYAADLAQARGWIERYFDAESERVRRVIAELSELEKTPVTAEAPSLSETFAALRMLQARSSGVRPSGASPGANAERDAADAPR